MPLYHASIALGFGMAAQALAFRFNVPGIVLLLVTGVAIGPDVLQILDPDALGHARTELVSLAVAIILFEGGLGLQMEDLRKQQRSLSLLLTIGAAISMAVGTLAAHYLLEMPWSTAALYGSLMIVTGPTVVTPLLARITVDRSVRDILVSEGVLIDPIGAIVAIVALEYVLEDHGMLATGGEVLWQLGIGPIAGTLWVASLSVAVFVPIKYLYPSKVEPMRLRVGLWILGVVWALTLAACIHWPDQTTPYFLIEVTLLYPAWYIWLSLTRGGLDRSPRIA